jgi:acylphosphatase
LTRTWFELRSINGSLSSLSGEPGFRNFVARSLREIGVSGYIRRNPGTDADLIVKGTPEQLSRVRDFLKKIKQQGMIQKCYVMNGTPMYEPEDEFEVMPSDRDRPRVVTGDYSNPEWDIVSVSTRSETPVLKSPNPHHSEL